jgi:hypothetical protein
MKKTTLLILLITIVIISNGQRKIKKLEVKEEGFNVSMNFQPIINEIIQSGLTFKITPVSADELNSIFLDESIFNGVYDYSHYEKSRNIYFQRKIKKKRKREKSNYEFLLEGGEWLFDNEMINLQEYNNLTHQINDAYNNEKKVETSLLERIILSNPYYIGNKYLTVFKIEFSNPSNSHFEFDEIITIESGNSSLRALPTALIKEELQKKGLLNLEKSLALERHNLPCSLLIPPDSHIEKYFAVLPLDYNNETIKISFSGYDTKFEWSIVKDVKSINELYTFYAFNLIWYDPKDVPFNGLNFNILKIPTSLFVFLGDSELFISESYLNEEFEIFTLSMHNDKLYYGRNRNIGIYFLDKEKSKRQSIKLMMESIDDLTKIIK